MSKPIDTTALPRVSADPAFPGWLGWKERTIYETRLIRAKDLRDLDVIRRPNPVESPHRQGERWIWSAERHNDQAWYDIYETWDGSNWEQAVNTFGGSSNLNPPYAQLIEEACDWAVDMWVVIRWCDRAKSNGSELEDGLWKVYCNQLIEVQVPVAIQEGVPSE